LVVGSDGILRYDDGMRRQAWGRVFRGMVASATAGLSACGGQIGAPGDASVDARDVDGDGASADGSADAGADAGMDAAFPLVNVSECQTEKGSFCSALSVYDLACVRTKLGLPDGASLSADDLKRLVTDLVPCSVDLPTERLLCGQLCPGGPGRPAHVVFEGEPHDMSTLAGFFAECAAREAGSVFGFEQVARDLVAHGAPERLIAWAQRSAREEVRHAIEMRAEARHRGIEPRACHEAPPIQESLFEFARANLAEGCVAETYSALQLVWMGDHAAAEHRALFARTADDEVAHAGLAYEIHEWVAARLSEEERGALREVLHRALREMVVAASMPPPSALAEIGMPPAEVAEAIALRLAGHLLDHPGLG